MSNYIDADFTFIAEKGDAQLQLVASEPADSQVTDGLLLPFSIAACAIDQGMPSVVDDRADTRSTVATDPPSETHTVPYRSLVVTPIEGDRGLAVAATGPSTFTEVDLRAMQIIAAVASPLWSNFTDVTRASEERNIMDNAAAVLSHDASNFLNIIYGNLELAAKVRQEIISIQSSERATDSRNSPMTFPHCSERAVDLATSNPTS